MHGKTAQTRSKTLEYIEHTNIRRRYNKEGQIEREKKREGKKAERDEFKSEKFLSRLLRLVLAWRDAETVVALTARDHRTDVSNAVPASMIVSALAPRDSSKRRATRRRRGTEEQRPRPRPLERGLIRARVVWLLSFSVRGHMGQAPMTTEKHTMKIRGATEYERQ